METNKNTKEQVILFFILTYAVSWIFFFIGYKTDQLLIILLGIWSPSMVGIILNGKFYGKKGLRHLFGRFKRTNIKWYYWILLLLLPAAIHFTGRSIWQLIYDGELNAFYKSPMYWASAIIPSFLIAGIGEEFGWRGFALPRLQRHFTPLKASVILALVHLFWHLPTYWLGQGIHNVPLVFILAFVFPWTFIFNWLYNKSGGSMIFAISFHAISNASLSIIRFMPLDREVPISIDLITQLTLPANLAGPYLTVCATYAVVALLVIKFGGFNKVNSDIP